MNYINLLTSKEQNFIERIVTEHSKYEEIQTVAVIGSLAKGYYSEISDIDILILVEDQEFKFEECIKYIENLGVDVKMQDDAFDIKFENRNISLLYKSSETFLEYIGNVIEGQCIELVYKTWAYGGVISDVILIDMRNAIVLFDKKGKLKEYSELLRKGYPEILSKKIVDYSRDLIKKRLGAIVKYENNILIYRIIVDELFVSFIRYVYAAKKEFNPGLKHIFSKNNIDFLETHMRELIEVKNVLPDVQGFCEYISKYIEQGDIK